TESGQGTLLINVGRAIARLTLDHWENLKPGLNGEFILQNFLDVSDDGLPVLNLQTKGPADPEKSLSSLLEHCSRHFSHVVVQVGIEVILPSILECIHTATRVYLLGSPSEEDFYHRELHLREPPRGQTAAAQIKTILYCESDQSPSELLR